MQLAVWQKSSKSGSAHPARCRGEACIPQQTSHLSTLRARSAEQAAFIAAWHREGGAGVGIGGGGGGIGGGWMLAGARIAASAECDGWQ